MLRIAVPNKGRLSEEVLGLFTDAGLPISLHGARALTAVVGDEFELLFLRAQDIPVFVADGAADAGVTGWDLVRESARELRTVVDLELGRCRLVVAGREDGVTDLSALPDGAAVATAFPRLAAQFFEQLGKRVRVVPMCGAVEVAPRLGVAEVIVDLVSTGSTLKSNGLRELAGVLESTARLVTRAEVGGDQARGIEDLASALSSVVRARSRRYLMANAPKEKLAEIREVLPGINGPTVVDVMDGGRFVAVHAVVATSSVYRTINSLRRLGCEGILLTRIERLVP
ncbi:MAG: ATP phosphoribosyltransferase [Myxococcota bacterium]|nr:ATP phosphoribosyltransferase [Myxococcota bacterium]